MRIRLCFAALSLIGGAGLATVSAPTATAAACTDIDVVAAHGTGTAKGDIAEIHAINDIFGDRAGEVSVMSIKGTLGHPTGAAGAIALVTALEGLRRGEVIHTGGTNNPDPAIITPPTMTPRRSGPMPLTLRRSHQAGARHPGRDL